jgi:hypothetical protein
MKPFEVTFEGELEGTPAQVWDAITVHTGGWLWPIAYEPRAGGGETGLTPDGGTVTVWEPHRRFATRAESPTGWWNQLEYEIEPLRARAFLRYRHSGALAEADYERVLDACRHHTAFYYHSLGEYLKRFAGRDATYETVDTEMPFADVCTRLRDTLPLGMVDYQTPHFLGIGTGAVLVRVYGREPWGMPVGVAQHVFEGAGVRLDEILRSEVAR